MKPWLKPGGLVFTGESSFQGFDGWCRISSIQGINRSAESFFMFLRCCTGWIDDQISPGLCESKSFSSLSCCRFAFVRTGRFAWAEPDPIKHACSVSTKPDFSSSKGIWEASFRSRWRHQRGEDDGYAGAFGFLSDKAGDSTVMFAGKRGRP